MRGPEPYLSRGELPRGSAGAQHAGASIEPGFNCLRWRHAGAYKRWILLPRPPNYCCLGLPSLTFRLAKAIQSDGLAWPDPFTSLESCPIPFKILSIPLPRLQYFLHISFSLFTWRDICCLILSAVGSRYLSHDPSLEHQPTTWNMLTAATTASPAQLERHRPSQIRFHGDHDPA